MDKFLTYINERRAKLQRSLLKLQDDIAELDKAERLYRASGAVDTSEADPDETAQALVALGAATPSVEEQMDGTIKQRVLRVLDGYPGGLTSGQILTILKTNGLPFLARESLSPQMSRLRKANEIALDEATSIWTRVRKHESQGA